MPVTLELGVHCQRCGWLNPQIPEERASIHYSANPAMCYPSKSIGWIIWR